jgi:late competence protein required for DNA uptake (superfamily II DNA/RNA helicase)
MKTYVHLRYYLAEFFLELEISQHVFYVRQLFPKNCAVYDNVENHRMYRCVPTTTMATQTRHKVALRIHCPSCLFMSTTTSDQEDYVSCNLIR